MMVTWGVMHNLCLTFNLYCIYIKITAITERESVSVSKVGPRQTTLIQIVPNLPVYLALHRSWIFGQPAPIPVPVSDCVRDLDATELP